MDKISDALGLIAVARDHEVDDIWELVEDSRVGELWCAAICGAIVATDEDAYAERLRKLADRVEEAIEGMAKIWREHDLVTAAKANTDVDEIWNQVDHRLVTESWHAALKCAAIATDDIRYQHRLRKLSDRVFALWLAEEQRRKTEAAAAPPLQTASELGQQFYNAAKDVLRHYDDGTLGVAVGSVEIERLRESVNRVEAETTGKTETAQ